MGTYGRFGSLSLKMCILVSCCNLWFLNVISMNLPSAEPLFVAGIASVQSPILLQTHLYDQTHPTVKNVSM